jgi:hypothetical protein
LDPGQLTHSQEKARPRQRVGPKAGPIVSSGGNESGFRPKIQKHQSERFGQSEPAVTAAAGLSLSEKAEGVGEIPEIQVRRQTFLPTVRCGPCPSLIFTVPGLAARDTMKLELPVSPTPLPSTGAGVSKAIALRGSLFDLRRPVRRSHRHPWRSKTVRRRWTTPSSSCAWSSSQSFSPRSSSSSFASSPCCPPS